jgi:hypothetical protein
MIIVSNALILFQAIIFIIKLTKKLIKLQKYNDIQLSNAFFRYEYKQIVFKLVFIFFLHCG